MRCSKARARLSEYMDSVLSPRRRQEMDDHFASCPSCNTLLREMGHVQAFLGELTEIKTPYNLASRIDRIPWESTQQHRSFSPFKLGFVMAAAAAVASVFLLRPLLIDNPTVPGDIVVAEIQEQTTETDVVEIRRAVLPEKRTPLAQARWVGAPTTRGVPLEGTRKTTSLRQVSQREEQIWQEVRRVSVCSRRSF